MTSNGPVFDHEKVTVIFVLGGPGSGKGTQCARLVEDVDFVHLSAGDLLRAEQNRKGSRYGDMIRTCIREGTIVPMEVTVKLLEDAMQTALQNTKTGEGWGNGRGRFLIDGFPRKMDQALMFDNEVCTCSMVLNLTCPVELMVQRVMERGKTSGREDDNEESIRKRLVTHEEQTMPVIEHYKSLGKVSEIDSTPKVDVVHHSIMKSIEKVLTIKIDN